MSFRPADSRLFFTKNDKNDPRVGEIAKPVGPFTSGADLGKALRAGPRAPTSFVLAGYPDDEGIRINGGRLGASQAPDCVRKPLYKMTPPLFPSRDILQAGSLFDLGNLGVDQLPLEKRHETVSEYALAALEAGSNWISIGGGHDYGFPDATAFIQWCEKTQKNVRPLVINFDAHLDVRPTSRDGGTETGFSSGTPFFRMLEKHPNVDFAEIGIQNHCNSRQHLTYVKSKGARVVTQEECLASGTSLTVQVTRVLDDWLLRRRPVFLSVDIDGFSSAVAPGCSQSWATGFMPQDFFPLFDLLVARLDVKALGIYEVSPPLDQDDRTAKLAAQIIYRVIS